MTGVQTCALPISKTVQGGSVGLPDASAGAPPVAALPPNPNPQVFEKPRFMCNALDDAEAEMRKLWAWRERQKAGPPPDPVADVQAVSAWDPEPREGLHRGLGPGAEAARERGARSHGRRPAVARDARQVGVSAVRSSLLGHCRQRRRATTPLTWTLAPRVLAQTAAGTRVD